MLFLCSHRLLHACGYLLYNFATLFWTSNERREQNANDWYPPDVVEMKFSGKRIWRPFFFPLSLSVRICLLPHAQMPPILYLACLVCVLRFRVSTSTIM